MRVWDLPPHALCMVHLNSEHREIHAIFSIINKGEKSPYFNHPEVKRWKDKLHVLSLRHRMIVKEMLVRKINGDIDSRYIAHNSPVDYKPEIDTINMVEPIESQISNIIKKSLDEKHACRCKSHLLYYYDFTFKGLMGSYMNRLYYSFVTGRLDVSREKYNSFVSIDAKSLKNEICNDI